MYIEAIFNNDMNSAKRPIVKLLGSIKCPYLSEGAERAGKCSINNFWGDISVDYYENKSV
jgi:hypothetical protein